jgi:Flp pilus assembly protein TadD
MADMDDEHRLLAARVAIAEARYREALDLLDRIPARTTEEEAQELVLVGQSFEGLNDVARASQAYTRAQSLAPTLPAPILREGVLRYHRGDTEGARRLLYRYIELESGNPEAYYYLSLCEHDPGRRVPFIGKVAVLDGPTGTWSSALLRSLGE